MPRIWFEFRGYSFIDASFFLPLKLKKMESENYKKLKEYVLKHHSYTFKNPIEVEHTRETYDPRTKRKSYKTIKGTCNYVCLSFADQELMFLCDMQGETLLYYLESKLSKINL